MLSIIKETGGTSSIWMVLRRKKDGADAALSLTTAEGSRSLNLSVTGDGVEELDIPKLDIAPEGE
jgi:hypothetical protein